VPAADAPPTLARCLAALDGADEVVVVDDAAPAPAAARNEGARRATGDVLVFVDADVVADGDALERIRAALETDPRLAALFGAYDDAPEAPGVVSTFRNLLHHHVHVESAGTPTRSGPALVRSGARPSTRSEASTSATPKPPSRM
jgi:glycosyltransferase involved in cell wall biosynthesis